MYFILPMEICKQTVQYDFLILNKKYRIIFIINIYKFDKLKLIINVIKKNTICIKDKIKCSEIV
jgi:hypothetical protein